MVTVFAVLFFANVQRARGDAASDHFAGLFVQLLAPEPGSLEKAVFKDAELSDTDFQFARTLALEWSRKDKPLVKAIADLTFDGTLEQVESGQVSPKTAAGIANLQYRRQELLLDRLQALRAGLGEMRFAALQNTLLNPPADDKSRPKKRYE